MPASRVTAVRPPGPPAGDVEVLRIHGALPLGVAARCCRLLGPGPLDECHLAAELGHDQLLLRRLR